MDHKSSDQYEDHNSQQLNYFREKFLSSFLIYGKEIYLNPLKLENLLHDICPGQNKEIFLITSILKYNIFNNFILSESDNDFNFTLGNLVDKLYNEHGFDKVLSKWALQTWHMLISKNPEIKIMDIQQGESKKISPLSISNNNNSLENKQGKLKKNEIVKNKHEHNSIIGSKVYTKTLINIGYVTEVTANNIIANNKGIIYRIPWSLIEGHNGKELFLNIYSSDYLL